MLSWRPQVAPFVNETTLLPVLVQLAPVKSVVDRFVAEAGTVFQLLGLDPRFINTELEEMTEPQWAKTANRSGVGTMTEFGFASCSSQ